MVEIFNQASRDHSAVSMDSGEHQGFISYGIKIIKDRHNKVTILNTNKGEYYEEISDDEYDIFRDRGWLCGIYTLSLSSYKRKLDEITRRITDEVNGRRRKKVLVSLKEERDIFSSKYFKVNQLLIKSNQDGKR
ncbi:MAG: hypothetical protein CMI60_05380 [Parvibaculum sp.]|nr:hypothetical protein [Parvibaculum sp.]